MKKTTIGLNGVAAAVLMALSMNVNAIEATNVSASADDGNVAANTVDNDLATRWSANGNDGSNWLQYDFSTEVKISAVNIAFYKGDSRSTYFEIQSSDNGADWTVELSGSGSGSTAGLEAFEFNSAVTAKYIRIVGLGNSSNTWNSITEVTFTDQPVGKEPGEVSAAASSSDGNVAENVLDGSLDTRWSANGSGEWLRLDLGEELTLNTVKLAFLKGNTRQSKFSIEVSNDDSLWTRVIDETNSSGSSVELEAFTFSEQTARYVRYTGYGNSSNTWNSVTEFSAEKSTVIICEDGYSLVDGKCIEDTIICEDGYSLVDGVCLKDVVMGSCNIDMSIWGYTTGDGVSMNNVDDIQDLIDNKTLGSNGAEEITFDDGCVTFKVENKAASSGGSTYPRSELRELLAEYNDSSVNVKGLTKNNWVTSDASSSNQSKVGGVDGNLKATLVVNTVSVDAESDDQIGRIVVGQIHGEDHEPVKIYYRKLPEHSKGSVFFTVDGSDGKPSDRINVIGFTDKNDRDEDASGDPVDPANGIALGDEWSYEIDLTGDQLQVTVWHDGYTYTTADSIAYTKTRSKQEIRVSSDSKAITISDFYADDYMYFKAGLYNQNKSGTKSPTYAEVTFSVIDVTHD